MALSLLSGRRLPEDSFEENYALVRKLLESFERKFGLMNCHTLLGCDIDTDQGQETYEERNIERTQYVAFATTTAQSLIDQRGDV